jgi:hypothetical protein
MREARATRSWLRAEPPDRVHRLTDVRKRPTVAGAVRVVAITGTLLLVSTSGSVNGHGGAHPDRDGTAVASMGGARPEAEPVRTWDLHRAALGPVPMPEVRPAEPGPVPIPTIKPSRPRPVPMPHVQPSGPGPVDVPTSDPPGLRRVKE